MNSYDAHDNRQPSPGLRQIHYDLKPNTAVDKCLHHPSPRSISPKTPNERHKSDRDQLRRETVLFSHFAPDRPELARHALEESSGGRVWHSNSGSSTDPNSPQASPAMKPEPKPSQCTAAEPLRVGSFTFTAIRAEDNVGSAQSGARGRGSPNPKMEYAPRAERVAAPAPPPSYGAIDNSKLPPIGCEWSRSQSNGYSPRPADVDLRHKRPRDWGAAASPPAPPLSPRRPSLNSRASTWTKSRNMQDFVIPESEAPQEFKLPAITAFDPQQRNRLPSSGPLPGVSELGTTDELTRPRAASIATTYVNHGRSSSVHSLLSPLSRPLSMPRPMSISVPGAYGEPSVATPVRPPIDSKTASPSAPKSQLPGHNESRRDSTRPPYPPFLQTSYHSSTGSSFEGSSTSANGSTANVTPSAETYTPTTLAATPSSDHQAGTETPSSTGYSNHASASAGGYECTHKGCEAPPFTTQYLLNSHTNVHSQERPHFCEVEGCPRSERGKNGEGGKGFKRKNEMVRHGLVHESPGYICPWCPDRAHKYPRPDNLQRHVRMHHDDKDKEDPRLRQVLNQRFVPGSSRGRKKRS